MYLGQGDDRYFSGNKEILHGKALGAYVVIYLVETVSKYFMNLVCDLDQDTILFNKGIVLVSVIHHDKNTVYGLDFLNCLFTQGPAVHLISAHYLASYVRLI